MTHAAAVTRPDTGAGPSAPVWPRWLAACLVIAAAAALPVLRFLVFWPGDQWQVDIEVYREAGVSLLIGRPVYSAMTEAPQLLPFTYPPFAALLAIPLALLPFRVAAWVWVALQVLANAGIVWYAGYRLIHRRGAADPLILAALTAPMLWLHPVSDGIRFGQVNAFLVLACLMDLRRPRPRVLRGLPPGVLVGLAMAIKLTPGVFVVHLLLCRRWREAATAVATAVGVTVAAFLLLPEASIVYWGGALTDPARLGPNMGTSNQSIRGALLRVGPEGLPGVLLWLVLAGIVGWLGFRVALRAWRAGETITEVAAVGLLACLLSPVAWIHHFHWMIVVILAILGADPLRDRRRLLAAGVITTWFLCRLPWWGITWLANDWPVDPVGRLLQNADTVGAVVALGLLWWTQHADPPGPRPATAGDAAAPAGPEAVAAAPAPRIGSA